MIDQILTSQFCPPAPTFPDVSRAVQGPVPDLPATAQDPAISGLRLVTDEREDFGQVGTAHVVVWLIALPLYALVCLLVRAWELIRTPWILCSTDRDTDSR